MRIAQLDDGESDDSLGSKMVPVRAKRALVGAGGRILFYPTLLYNVVRNKIQSEFRWWDEIDQFLLLGAVPFPKDVPCLQQLGVCGVITLNEPFETLVRSSLYQAYGIDHLVIPTRDYLFAPSFVDIYRAVDFIQRNVSCGRTTYVHCKAGRGRSTTIVLCYLVQYKHMTPAAALEYVRSRRPRVLLAPSQWRAVLEYSKRVSVSPIPTSNPNSCKDFCVPSRSIVQARTPMRLMPSSPPKATDGVLITDEDLEGYATDLSITSHRTVRSRHVMERLSCLFGALKIYTGGCPPVENQLLEIRAC